MSGNVFEVFLQKNGWTICEQWRPWSDAAFCGSWSGSALFANNPFRGLQTTICFHKLYPFTWVSEVLTSTHNLCFLLAEIGILMYTPVNPSFTYKVGFEGEKLYRPVFVMGLNGPLFAKKYILKWCRFSPPPPTPLVQGKKILSF